MTISRKWLCVTYGAIALAALVATWSQNILFIAGNHQSVGAFFATMVDEVSANYMAKSFTVDLLIFALVACIWMVIEARKHGIKYVWLYIVGAFAIAISVTFPLFLLARERALATTDQPRIGPADSALLGLVAVVVLAGVLWVNWF